MKGQNQPKVVNRLRVASYVVSLFWRRHDSRWRSVNERHSAVVAGTEQVYIRGMQCEAKSPWQRPKGLTSSDVESMKSVVAELEESVSSDTP